ncbi:SnoaL-like protein [Streptomyces puniciscabiei]|uniref:SnoaL-like protein n=1 Tax=Streptomyces puniciscabiei TaxID=164348 RepID=A0A542SXF9_9ACTN|nr:nuclear transport factor 2 family protein [Streptomyces puniciscabiei]TQK79291.1 SnoaL-like protein [Streptomyces puniciscabiei]
MSVQETPLRGQQSSVELYQQVQQFYARQMQLLDNGEVDAWMHTFTEDGVFATNAQPEPTVGREAIGAGARQAMDHFAAQGVQRRHLLGTVAVTGQQGTTVTARSYVLLMETPRGGRTTILCSATCEDVLELGPDGPAVRRREVSRDDLV